MLSLVRKKGMELKLNPRDLEMEISSAHRSGMGRTGNSWDSRLWSHEAVLSIWES